MMWPMVSRRPLAMPRLLRVGPGVLHGLGAGLASDFDVQHVVVVTGRDSSRRVGASLTTELQELGSRVEALHGPVGTLQGTACLEERLAGARPSLVVGVGGGRPIDVAKLVATYLGIDVVSVPTVLSHDGMCSPVASLVDSDGVRRSVGVTMPSGVVVDTEIVGRAPGRYLRAGIGDLVSNITAVEDWRLAAAVSDEVVDEFAATIALLSSKAAFDVSWPLGDDDLSLIARALVMSGIAMEVAGSSRPCSGAEHLVSHALDELRGHEAAIHGEQVALGSLVTARLHDVARTGHIAPLFERVGFPTRLEGWGLDERTLTAAIQRAPSTRPGRHTVLDEIDLSTPAVRELVATTFGRASSAATPA